MQEEVGILYICTGRYRSFWEKFYKTAEQFFLPEFKKHYYVWSNFVIPKKDNVTYIPCKWLGWPDETLRRYHRFLEQEDELRQHKYLYFFNANMEVEATVHACEVLPVEGKRLVAAIHAQFWNHDSDNVQCRKAYIMYEQNPYSQAYISDQENHDYVMGGFNGGYTDDYLTMARCIRGMVELDLAMGIIPKFHDESYMNKYAEVHPFRLLTPSYLYPEWWTIKDAERKILLINKWSMSNPRAFRESPTLRKRGLHDRLKN